MLRRGASKAGKACLEALLSASKQDGPALSQRLYSTSLAPSLLQAPALCSFRQQQRFGYDAHIGAQPRTFTWFGVKHNKEDTTTTATTPPEATTPSLDNAEPPAAEASSAADALLTGGNIQDLDPSVFIEAAQLAEQAAIAACAEGMWLPTKGVFNLLVAAHTASGLDWWQSIIITTVGIRTLMLPVMVAQMKNTAKMTQARPEMQQLVEWMKTEQARGNPNAVQEYQSRLYKVWQKYDCNPLKSLAGIIVQAPLFITFFSVLRAMAAAKVPSLVTGGALWFSDLTVPDPYYITPVLASAIFLLTVELGAADGMQGQPPEVLQRLKWVMRFIGVGMLPFTVQMPNSVFMYWITSSLFSLFQTMLFKIPGFKKKLGIPELGRTAAKTGATAIGALPAGKPVQLFSHNPKQGKGKGVKQQESKGE